ncbi:MAG: hypothetical protein HY048_17245 [Acidobacteria bacterium]|nr:hypothetical protein [Acidobacteriota bacterium]
MAMRRAATWVGALGLMAVTVLPLIGCGSSSPAAPSNPQAGIASLSSAVQASTAIGGSASPVATASDDGPSAQTVSALVAGTACPTLQFKVNGNVVQTNASTKYEGGTCASIQAGAKLTLTGSRANDHELFVATLVTFSKTSTTTTTTTTTTTDTHSDAVKAEGVVTGLVSGTACPTLSFRVGAYTVKVTAATTFSAGACGDVKAGATVNLVGTRQTDGSVVASRVSVKPATTTTTKDETHDDHNEPFEGESVVTGLVAGTSCPTLSFLIGPYTLKVTAATAFADGACADVKVGSMIHVAGTRQADGSLLVTRLVLKPATHAEEPVEGEATVSSVKTGTACPTLEFMLADRYVVKVTATTTFQGGTCADIKVGAKLHVRGAVGADGSVTASSVTIQGGETHREAVEGDGGVTSLVTGTACPALSFKIGEYTISVDSSTLYVGGTCADIKAGAKVGVKGSVGADKSVSATRITFRHDD